LVGYLGKTLLPTSLAVFYPHPHVGLGTWPVAGAALLLACITAGALLTAKRAPFFIVGWLWYLGTLAPVIGIVQVGEQAMADRYTYLPLVGVFIAVAWGLCALASAARPARYAVAAAVAAWLVTLLAVTRVQVRTWAGSVALFEHALAVTSDNWMAHNNLGSILSDASRTDEAIAHFGEVLRIRPDFPEGRYNLGLVLERTGRHLEAIGHYQEALRLRPGYTDARFNLGNALLHAGRLAEAIEQYQEVLRLDPGFVGAATNLRLARGRADRAAEGAREKN
jgi:tetratricopeptide (TPR) repeat protein